MMWICRAQEDNLDLRQKVSDVAQSFAPLFTAEVASGAQDTKLSLHCINWGWPCRICIADAANDTDNARIYTDMRIDLHRCAWPSLVLTLAALLLVRGPARQPHDITNNFVMCNIACHVNQNCST